MTCVLAPPGEASGRDLLATPLIIFCAHLAIGDVWNHINNVEKRMGVAVPGVLCCWASAVAAFVAYYQADQTAGQLLCACKHDASWLGCSCPPTCLQSCWPAHCCASLPSLSQCSMASAHCRASLCLHTEDSGRFQGLAVVASVGCDVHSQQA
eukprot:scaffold159288_cov19-Tisochrysis_lutea.AAC.1